jgi:hypothetical protein
VVILLATIRLLSVTLTTTCRLIGRGASFRYRGTGPDLTNPRSRS